MGITRKAKLRLPKRKAQDVGEPDAVPLVRRLRYSDDSEDEKEAERAKTRSSKRRAAIESESEVSDSTKKQKSTKKKQKVQDSDREESPVRIDDRNVKDKHDSRKKKKTSKKTPKRATRRADQELNDTEVALNNLMNSTCNILHVGPIYISFEPEAIEEFCRALVISLMEKAPSLIETRGQKKATFYVKAEMLEGIAITPSDSESVMIQIFREMVDEDNDNDDFDRKELFSALFTSCGSQGVSQKRGTKQFRLFDDDDEEFSPKNLPVFLWYGKTRTWDLVRPLLETHLECNFHSIHFSPVHMQIFAGIWLHQEVQRGSFSTQNKSDGVSIDYMRTSCAPKSQKTTKMMTTELNFSHWKHLFEEVDYSLEDNLPMKQILMKVWNEAFDAHSSRYKDDLTRADFVKIKTTSCVVTSNGRLKLRKKTKLAEFQAVLSQLTRIVELR